MRRLDFISGSPQLNIFREGANKTNLGGALYLIYILVLILLAIIYIFDYFSNEKYEFDYTLVKTDIKDKKLQQDEEMNSMLNVNIDYFFRLSKDDSRPERNIFSNDFIIVDNQKIGEELNSGRLPMDDDGFFFLNSTENSNFDEAILKQNYLYSRNAGKLQLSVLYRCKGTDCRIREEDKIQVTSYYLFVGYKGFNLEHQHPEKPIQPLPEDNYWLETVQFLENTNIVYLNWELIEYEEEQGIFAKTYNHMVGNSQTYYGGYYKTKETFTDDGHVKNIPDTDMRIKDLNGNHFTLLLYLQSFGNNREYERYSRKKISFLDVLADVSALASTVLDLMALAYGFLYEENYDNYKIIENILTKKMNIIINNQKIIKEDDEEDKIELKTDLIESNSSEENEKTGINIKENTQGEEKRYKENLDLPSPNFLDFLFNKLYFKCFGPSSKQNLIDSCNDIVAKYITIENILYNQMKLEYLWKDYKWNNPQNEIGQKDGLILGLKEK